MQCNALTSLADWNQTQIAVVGGSAACVLLSHNLTRRVASHVICKKVLIGDSWAGIWRSDASLDGAVSLVDCSLQSNFPVYLFNNVVIRLVLLDEVFETHLSFSSWCVWHVTNLLLIRHHSARSPRAHFQESLGCAESGCARGATSLASAVESCSDLQVSVTSNGLGSHGEGRLLLLVDVGRGDRWCVRLVPLWVGAAKLSLFLAIHSFQTTQTWKSVVRKRHLFNPKKQQS